MLPGSPGIAEPYVLTMCSYNFVLRSLPVLAISGNDICSHRHQEPGCVWRMAKKPAKTSARGLDLHGTLGKAGGPGAAPEHVFKVTHWPRLPPPSTTPTLALSTYVKEKAHVCSTRTNMEFLHPGVSRPAPRAARTAHAGARPALALVCEASLRPAAVRPSFIAY